MIKWDQVYNEYPIDYKCAYCEHIVASNYMFSSEKDRNGSRMNLVICPKCYKPTFFDFNHKQYPSPIFGNKVEHLTPNVESLYNEARQCTQVNAYTSSVLACRKLLMNIAVDKGAREGLHFEEYVNYLDSKGYIPPDGKHWVDIIRKKGNEATHEIKLKNEKDASDLLIFMEMLLKFVFEFPTKGKEGTKK